MEILFLISFIVVLLTYFVSGSISSFAVSLFTLALGIIFAQTIKREFRRNGLILFFIVFTVYTLFAIFHYLGYYYDYYNFELDWKDEYKFFLRSQTYEYTSLSNIWRDCFVNRIHIENEGYIFYIASLSSIGRSCFDGNHLLYQFLGTTLCGSLISILLYRFLILYVDDKEAFKYTLFFLLCSVFFQYSIYLLRDIFIAFFYLWGFIIISQKFTVKGFLGLLFLSFLIWQFRYEHGLFFIIFIFYYLYCKFQKYKFPFIVLTLALVIISSTFFVENYLLLSNNFVRYSEFTEESALSKDESIGKFIWMMPSPIKEIGILINSQLQPFPSWIGLEKSKNIFESIVHLQPIVYSFFWFTIMFALIKWLLQDKKYKMLPFELIIVLIIASIFLIGNIANMSIRRIMCVYPIFYLVYVIIKSKYTDSANVKNTFMYSTLTYSSLIFVYLIVKYV